MTPTQPETNRLLKMLVFGAAGSGKTVLASTAQDDPRTAPVLILDLEGGTDSLVGRKIDIVRIKGWKDYSEAYEEVQKGGKYATVICDSLSELQLFSLNDILEKEGASRRDKDLLTLQDHGKSLHIMRRFVRTWRDLPINFIATALSRETTDPREGTVVVPKFSGQFTEDASAMFSVVAYLALTTDGQSNATKRILLLKNQSRFRVKARTPLDTHVPDTLPDPTVGRLLDVLHFPAPDPVTT